MVAIIINEIQIANIKSRAETGNATNQDCLDLFLYIEKLQQDEGFKLEKIKTALGAEINDRIDGYTIACDVVEYLKTKKAFK